MNWRLAYAIGFHPWEDTDPPFLRKISELFDREEKGRQPPYGPALDLGTGSDAGPAAEAGRALVPPPARVTPLGPVSHPDKESGYELRDDPLRHRRRDGHHNAGSSSTPEYD
jgi:hypothetical protein